MKVEIITNCPSCDSLLERVNDQLFCRNKNCGAVGFKRVENFTKVMKIKGLGPASIEKLEFTDIQHIYEVSKEYYKEFLGEKIGSKVFEEVEKSKNSSLAKFLAACSIPLIGKSAADKIATKTDDPNKITVELCKDAGLGDKASKNLVDWVDNIYSNMILPISFNKNETKNNDEVKYTVCITGKIKGFTKAQLADILSKNGVKVVDSVTKKINYLICNEKKGSSKEKKAENLNIEILTFNEFKEIINV